MKMSRLALFAVLASGAAMATPYDIDASHSSAGFGVRHMMVSTVRGQFSKVAGTVDIDDADLSRSKVEVTIDPASIDTRDAKRDGHLKSPDFFDVAKYPAITFKSTRIAKQADGKILATGDLTLHGVTKPVTLTVDNFTAPIKDGFGRTIRGVSATGKINRKDYGLTWNKALEAGGVAVGEDVQLQLDVELVQQQQSKTAQN
jgi:polyisoprenoid-binding protein YceI